MGTYWEAIAHDLSYTPIHSVHGKILVLKSSQDPIQ